MDYVNGENKEVFSKSELWFKKRLISSFPFPLQLV
jgi:hypothetical protein